MSVILSITGNDYKLPPFIIVKGEATKTIEKELNNIWFVKEKLVHIICQTEGWCTTNIFIEWIKKIFINYAKDIGNQCLLKIDKDASLISKDSIAFLDANKVDYVLIPSGMIKHFNL